MTTTCSTTPWGRGFTVAPFPFARIRHMVRGMTLQSTITCPLCGASKSETMPTDACMYFYDCTGCGAVLKPKAGDCCVFCSYGTAPCPPIQAGDSCCSG